MNRLLTTLLVATMLAPLAVGIVAVAAGFGDPWGMGAQSFWGVFMTAVLPVFPPGFYQVVAWPATFGVAFLLSPILFFGRPRHYMIAAMSYLAAISIGWVLAWKFNPDILNGMFDTQTFVPGRLNSNVWKFGVILLTDAALLALALLKWYWRESAANPS